MKLDELIRMGFERGCGISLEEATASRRYWELLDSSGNHPYPTQMAQIQLLGEHLIDVAWDCLPRDIQMIAEVWPYATAEDQLVALEGLLLTFKSDRWYEKRGLKFPTHHKQSASDVLPCEYGSWETGTVCPSCLGLATMLMAFAKRTGANHWLAHALKSIMLEVQSMDYEIGSSVMSFLRDRLPVLAEAGGLGELDKRYQAVLNEIIRLNRYNFHPALVIQLKDGRWALCDPYFGTLAVLEEPDWPISGAIDMMVRADFPGNVVQVGSRYQVFRYREQLVQESGYLGGFITGILEQIAVRKCNATELVGAVQVLREMVEYEPLRWLKPLISGEVTDTRLIAQGIFGEHENMTDEAASRAFELLDQDPQFARLAVERMLYFVVTLWVQRVIDDLERIARTAPHSSLELAQPANAVAVGTLNNLRCYHGSRPRSVGGVLVLFSRAQSIWHDAMLDVLKRTRVPPLIAEALRQLEVGLASGSPEYLHPYVARLLAVRRSKRESAVWQHTVE